MNAAGSMIFLAHGGWDTFVVVALMGFMMLGVGGAALYVLARAFRGWLGGGENRRADPDGNEKDSGP